MVEADVDEEFEVDDLVWRFGSLGCCAAARLGRRYVMGPGRRWAVAWNELVLLLKAGSR